MKQYYITPLTQQNDPEYILFINKIEENIINKKFTYDTNRLYLINGKKIQFCVAEQKIKYNYKLPKTVTCYHICVVYPINCIKFYYRKFSGEEYYIQRYINKPTCDFTGISGINIYRCNVCLNENNVVEKIDGWY